MTDTEQELIDKQVRREPDTTTPEQYRRYMAIITNMDSTDQRVKRKLEMMLEEMRNGASNDEAI